MSPRKYPVWLIKKREREIVLLKRNDLTPYFAIISRSNPAQVTH
jgi:hypothetical protein